MHGSNIEKRDRYKVFVSRRYFFRFLQQFLPNKIFLIQFAASATTSELRNPTPSKRPAEVSGKISRVGATEPPTYAITAESSRCLYGYFGLPTPQTAYRIPAYPPLCPRTPPPVRLFYIAC